MGFFELTHDTLPVGAPQNLFSSADFCRSECKMHSLECKTHFQKARDSIGAGKNHEKSNFQVWHAIR